MYVFLLSCHFSFVFFQIYKHHQFKCECILSRMYLLCAKSTFILTCSVKQEVLLLPCYFTYVKLNFTHTCRLEFHVFHIRCNSWSFALCTLSQFCAYLEFQTWCIPSYITFYVVKHNIVRASSLILDVLAFWCCSWCVKWNSEHSCSFRVNAWSLLQI